MIANFPIDGHDGQQLRFDLERIRKECPTFVAWLAQSVEDTIDNMCQTDGSFLVRQTGELNALRKISGIIANPPQAEASANASTAGMVM